MSKSKFIQRFVLGAGLLASFSTTAAFGQMAETTSGPSAPQLSAVSGSDREAFAEVYDLLSEDYLQREKLGNLFDNYSINQPSEPTQVAAVPTAPTQAAAPTSSPATPAGFSTSAQQQEAFVPVNKIDTPIADLGEIEDLALDEDFSDEETGNSGGFLDNIYLGAYVAGNFPNKSSATLVSQDTYDLESQFGFGGGGLVGYKYGQIHAELEGMYTQSTRKTANSTDITQQPNDEEETTTTLAGLVNAYYKVAYGPVNFYGGGSVGYAQYKSKLGTNESSGTGLTYGPLVGASYNISSNLELAAQYRYLIASGVSMTNDVSNTTSDRDMSQHQAMLALRFSF